ncbi:AMP-binding protein [Streptomyces cyaneofuscatus]|uniref:AMP-binding protein n=1 Tax=Streptomyces cyaneofuscatus TaxID=66883 RepID=A0ABZ1EW96_9ACTN|nr:AMP-binding protein [Streptomyces cyaneofuscatus]WSB08286.1 AMP-binding protein [Streptomyces cyaneofuscatus]WSD48181.1 AMP-binding protein [Streptomyces cyaneofuscatus]WTA91554.1 AMP-binding protein [Streptomyces cyaneofuscatus]
MATGPASQRLLHEGFLRSLERDEGAEALRIGAHHISYRRLHDHALALAGSLVASAPRPLRRVGVLAARSESAYAGLLAALYTGAAVVPLNAAFPAERLRYMVTAASLDGLVVDERGLRALRPLADVLDGVAVVTETIGPPLTEPLPASPDDVAYILFTSGSSGRPKGVPVLHSAAVAYLHQVQDRYAFTSGDTFSQTYDLTFDLAMFDLFVGWGSGGTVVSVPPHAYVSLPEFISRHGITVWFSTPRMIALARQARGLEPGSFPTLRWSLFCGEPLLVRDAAQWQDAAPHSPVENLYGPTELTVSCTAHRFDPKTSPERAVNGIVPIGTLHPNLRHLLLGAEDDAQGTGELCVTGDQMFRGYLDPSDDFGRFVEHEGERWYRTGDLVRPAGQGELAYIGRNDQQVSIGGVRVELAEIESGLRRLSGVREAVAVAAAGQLVAFCVGVEKPVPLLLAELGSFLPRYMVPRHFEYLEELPLNANRKIDRRALSDRARVRLQPDA